MRQPSTSVTYPQGYRTGVAACGVKRSGRPDLSVIVSDRDAAAAAAFTQNRVVAAPILIARERLIAHPERIRGILTVSGVANAMTGPPGVQDNQDLLRNAESTLGLDEGSLLPACTGVIGPRLPLDRLIPPLSTLRDNLARSPEADQRLAHAILTTDTVPKTSAVRVRLGDGTLVRIGGVAKGSGMIAPRLSVAHATILAFLTTDARATSGGLSRALARGVDSTFNMVCIDGDTSTNDTVYLMANGAARGPLADGDPAFEQGVTRVLESLARQVARDGEGATKLLTVTVEGARNIADARKAARAVVGSTLVKAALFGADPNVGRIACALGYSGAKLDPERIDIGLKLKDRPFPLVECGQRASSLSNGGERKARELLRRLEEVPLSIHLHEGRASATAWGCDLSYTYVQINAAYRT